MGPASFATNQNSLEDMDWLERPKEWFGPSTAWLEMKTIAPVQDGVIPLLPKTILSDDPGGPKRVTVKSAERILALDISGSLAATVWALGLGDRLVGRDVSSDFPEIRGLPIVTSSGHTVSAEAILQLRPDLLITDGSIGPTDVITQLRQAGVTVVFTSEVPGLAAPGAMARKVSTIFGIPEVGANLGNLLDEQIGEVVEAIERNTPKSSQEKLRMVFLYIRGASGIYYLFGRESGSSELIEGLGGIDVATEIGWTGLRPMTDEALIAANPDLILVMSQGLESVGGAEALVRLKPAIGLTRAGKNLRFVDMADSQILSFGPRTPQIMIALAQAIYDPRE